MKNLHHLFKSCHRWERHPLGHPPFGILEGRGGSLSLRRKSVLPPPPRDFIRSHFGSSHAKSWKSSTGRLRPRSMVPAEEPSPSTRYVMSLLETMSAIMVVVLSLGLAAVLWRAVVYLGRPPQTAHLPARTTTTTTTYTQTTGSMITYPNTVFVTNTGGTHSSAACGGLRCSRTTRSVTFCQTCAERARSLAAMYVP